MEIEKIFGLPAHPFFVHFSVVLIPLASLLALVLALRPRWFDRFGIGLVILSGIGAVGGLIAEGSGEALEESVENSVSRTALESHAEMGELAAKLGMLFFLLVCVAVGLRWWSVRTASSVGGDQASSDAAADTSGLAAFASSRRGAAVLAAIVVLAGAGATYAVSVAGHRGAGLTWKDTSVSGGEDSEREGDSVGTADEDDYSTDSVDTDD